MTTIRDWITEQAIRRPRTTIAALAVADIAIWVSVGFALAYCIAG